MGISESRTHGWNGWQLKYRQRWPWIGGSDCILCLYQVSLLNQEKTRKSIECLHAGPFLGNEASNRLHWWYFAVLVGAPCSVTFSNYVSTPVVHPKNLDQQIAQRFQFQVSIWLSDARDVAGTQNHVFGGVKNFLSDGFSDVSHAFFDVSDVIRVLSLMFGHFWRVRYCFSAHPAIFGEVFWVFFVPVLHVLGQKWIYRYLQHLQRLQPWYPIPLCQLKIDGFVFYFSIRLLYFGW